MAFEQSLQFFFIALLCNIVKCADEVPRGHNMPLGHHRDSEGHIDILEEMPTPQEFWDSYCSIGKPALLKGAALSMPAMTKWSDEYLSENFGDLMVKLESKSEKHFTPVGKKGVGQDTIKNFIETYRKKNKYMVSQLPDPLADDVVVPQCLLCGSFRDRILETNIWMSSGDTTSLLHGDSDNALNCLLYGSKDWILIDPIYEKSIPIVIESGHPNGGFSALNVNKMDLIAYPEFKDVPWYYANVSAGDCLFLPKGHQHQVRSYGSRNIAVSLLVSRLEQFEPYGCPENGLPPSEKLTEVPLVWTYDGYTSQSMGNPDPFTMEEIVMNLCNKSDGFLDAEAFLPILLNNIKIDEEGYKGSLEVDEEEFEIDEANMKLVQENAKSVIDFLEPSKSGKWDCSNVKSLNVDMMKTLSNLMDADPHNDEDYEFKDIHAKDIE